MSKIILAVLVVSLALATRAESIVESQQRHLVMLKQKLVEMKARLKDGAPEITDLEELMKAQTKFVAELRNSTQDELKQNLDEIEKALDQLRGGRIKADPVREALLEQARGTLLRRLLENQLGFELDKDVPGLPPMTIEAAAADTVRTGAISFRIPDNADANAVDQVKKQIARIAPNVELNYVEPMRVMTASGGDAVQLRRVQGLASAIREAAQSQRVMRGGFGGGGGGDAFGGGFGGGGPGQRREAQGGDMPQRQQGPDGMRPPRPPAPPEEEKKPKELTNDKF